MRKPAVLTVLMFLMLLAVSIVIVSAFDITITSSAQNANSSTSTNKNQNQNQNQNDTKSVKPPSGAGGQQQDFSQNTWELPADADKTKNPTPATPESIAKGKELYLDRNKGNCIFCHGETGSGNEATRARMRRKPADLSNKERMTSMTDGELFWKISKGITGIMPPGERRMSEEERWDVVNFVRTVAKDTQ